MSVARLKYLIERCLSLQATPVERTEMLDLLTDPKNESVAKQIITNSYEREGQLEDINAETAVSIFQAIVQSDKKTAKIKSTKSGWWAVAASILILLSLGVYFFINSKPNTAIAIRTLENISAPTTNRAMITLADGNKVFLDSARNGKIAQVGNIKLIKLANGQIAYETADGKVLKELQYNTLTNPEGSQVIDMQLSDGSHVWLNAGSSITYPVAFVGGDRKVELRGEGYFEVAKDASKRFIVAANTTTTEVLGTHFNVNAYGYELTKVTLLEGSVVVKNKNTFMPVSPGDQARITPAGMSRVQANVDQVIAWKESLFNFDEMNLKEVMEELGRWYQIRVAYEGNIQRIIFGGSISRTIDLEDILNILKKSGLRIHWDAVKRELKVYS